MPEFESEQESRLWRWMLGIVVLALVVWAVAELTGSDRRLDQASAGPAAVEAPVETPLDPDRDSATPVTGAEFQAWVRDSADVHERMRAPEYVAAGLHRLLSALRGLAVRTDDSELELRATALDSAVDGLMSGGAQVGAVRDLMLNSADLVAEAALRTGAAAAINQSVGEPAVEPSVREALNAVEQNVRDARHAARALDPDNTLDRQRHHAFTYFDHMGEAIVRAADLAVTRRP